MASSYKVHAVILCDDIRMEIGGKPILLGVYADAIVVEGNLPIVLPTLSVYIQLKTEKKRYERNEISLRDPNNTEVAKLQGMPADFPYPQFLGNIMFRLTPVILTSEGRYTVHFGMEEAPEEICGFFVIKRASLTAEKS